MGMLLKSLQGAYSLAVLMQLKLFFRGKLCWWLFNPCYWACIFFWLVFGKSLCYAPLCLKCSICAPACIFRFNFTQKESLCGTPGWLQNMKKQHQFPMYTPALSSNVLQEIHLEFPIFLFSGRVYHFIFYISMASDLKLVIINFKFHYFITSSTSGVWLTVIFDRVSLLSWALWMKGRSLSIRFFFPVKLQEESLYGMFLMFLHQHLMVRQKVW